MPGSLFMVVCRGLGGNADTAYVWNLDTMRIQDEYTLRGNTSRETTRYPMSSVLLGHDQRYLVDFCHGIHQPYSLEGVEQIILWKRQGKVYVEVEAPVVYFLSEGAAHPTMPLQCIVYYAEGTISLYQIRTFA
jgi:hypothetical protein